jgi:calcium-dependent protein kinase
MATREEKTELLKVFESLDLNHDGMLSREELVIGYSKIMPNDEAEEEVDRIM